MTPSSRFWADLSTLEFSDRLSSGAAAHTVAVLPVAAIEQHGPHLPLSVDTVLVNGVVAAALPHLSPELPVLFLPTQAVGFSPEHARFPGTLTLKSDTLVRLWTEIGESVAAAGVKKLVLFNAHGGQVSVMDLVARDLRARLDMLVYSVSWFNLPLVDALGRNVNDLFSADEHRYGIHAGDVETSMMLALDPTHVDMAKARHFHSTSQDRASQFDILGNGKSAKLGWQTQDYNPAGAVGNAAAATGDKGQALVDAAGLGLARLLAQVHQLPLSTLVAAPDFSPP
jgi:creatinine amidohydrolase